MVFARIFGSAAALAMMAVLAGCATTQSSLRSSADRLERNADALARDARGYDSSEYSRDAVQLADEAHDDSRADRRDIDAAFQELSRKYHDLRDEIDRSNSREAQVDFRPVTEAYLDVERAVGGYPDRDSRRYARDRDRDPYDRTYDR